MSDASDIDAAVIGLLQNDATLKALMPDGVFMDEAPPGARRFCLLGLIEARDRWEFGRVAQEENLYFAKAVGLSTVSPNMKGAAARIHELLQDQTVPVPGYTCVEIVRDDTAAGGTRIRKTEVDGQDPSIRWFHRGGHYRVICALP